MSCCQVARPCSGKHSVAIGESILSSLSAFLQVPGPFIVRRTCFRTHLLMCRISEQQCSLEIDSVSFLLQLGELSFHFLFHVTVGLRHLAIVMLLVEKKTISCTYRSRNCKRSWTLFNRFGAIQHWGNSCEDNQDSFPSSALYARNHTHEGKKAITQRKFSFNRDLDNWSWDGCVIMIKMSHKLTEQFIGGWWVPNC